MAIDITEASKVDERGIALTDNDDNVILYLTSGTGDPTGSSAPSNTWYFRQDTQTLWYKFGATDADWRQVRAQDITYDPATTDLTAIQLQAAIEQLANRHYGKDFNNQSKEASETTTGGTFAIYDTLNFTVSSQQSTNRYRLNADFRWGHNSGSNDIIIDVQVDGVTIRELRIEAKDTGTDQRYQNNILIYVDDLSAGAHTFSLRYRPATANRVSRMYSSELEVWRVS
jgi:hypothetical protein